MDSKSSIDWKQSFRKAGTSAFITGVSSGIALWAIDHPRFRTFGAKVKSLGYDKIKALLKKSELSEETIEAFCRRFGIAKIGKVFTVAELKLLKRVDLSNFVKNNLDDLLSDANRKIIWDLTDETAGQFKRGDLIEEIFNQLSDKYKSYINLNDIIPNYKTLDFDGILGNVAEVVSLKTYHPKLAFEKTLSGITGKIKSYAEKLSKATLDATHNGKNRVLDFTVKKGEWTNMLDDIQDIVKQIQKNNTRVTIRITEF